MGRSKMSSLKITLFPLAICLLLSLNSQVSGKPSPKHFLIDTKEKAKKNSDYIDNINNSGGQFPIDKSLNVGRDYINGINNDESVGVISNKSFNVAKDYMCINILNAQPRNWDNYGSNWKREMCRRGC